jgi:hypothetical protein
MFSTIEESIANNTKNRKARKDLICIIRLVVAYEVRGDRNNYIKWI